MVSALTGVSRIHTYRLHAYIRVVSEYNCLEKRIEKDKKKEQKERRDNLTLNKEARHAYLYI